MNNGTRKELWIGFALFQFLLNIVYYSADCCGVAVDGGTHSMCPRGLWYLPQLVDNLFIGTKSIPGQLNWRVDKFIKFFVTYLDRPTNQQQQAMAISKGALQALVEILGPSKWNSHSPRVENEPKRENSSK